MSRASDGLTSGLDVGEHVTSLVASRRGTFAVLTSTNRVFFGVVGSSSRVAIEIQAGISPLVPASLRFDGVGGLSVIETSTTRPFVTSRVVSVQNEVLNIPTFRSSAMTGYAETCDFMNFSAGLSSTIYLDQNEEFSFLPVLTTPRSGRLNGISTAISNIETIRVINKALPAQETLSSSSSPSPSSTVS